MNQQNMQRSGRRSSRGGSRRPRRDGGRSDAPQKAPVKKTFWQKIAAFFSGEQEPPRQANGSKKYESPRQKPSRKPEVVEVTSPKLYVGNLSFDATESDLFDLFNGVGKVNNAEVVSHRDTQHSKGFAFVTMNTVDEARRAVTELHDKEFMGRKLVVSGAKTSDTRGG